MKGDAVLSADLKYRYQLSRVWDESKPKILFIMCNPSSADAENDDRTTRKVIKYAKSWGYGGLFIGNLYGIRNVNPKEIKYTYNPEGEDNKKHVKQLLKLGTKVVYAWGNYEKEPSWLRKLVDTPYCIDVSTKGVPKQPLRLSIDLSLKKFIRD